MKAKRILGVLFLLGFLGVAATGGAFFYWMSSGEPSEEMVELVIPRGASAKKITAILVDNQLISNPKLFRVLLRLSGASTRARAGEFRFRRHASPLETLKVLYYSEPIVHAVTIPEGYNVRQIAEVLSAAHLIDPQVFLPLALGPTLPAKNNLNLPSTEGILFPDTYLFSKIDGEERILERMIARFLEKVPESLRYRSKERGMTFEQLLTLASVIEKESGIGTERRLVSSVFWNRLKKGMRLQSDPTTIYGIANFNGNLTRADLERYSPYNTYVIPALPPGPICNPGLDSILAALDPATSNYLFFVSNNQGVHLFSETYQQHSRFVNSYQKAPSRKSAAKPKHRRKSR